MLNVFQIGILLRGAMESPTSFLKVLAEFILLGVLGHLSAHCNIWEVPSATSSGILSREYSRDHNIVLTSRACLTWDFPQVRNRKQTESGLVLTSDKILSILKLNKKLSDLEELAGKGSNDILRVVGGAPHSLILAVHFLLLLYSLHPLLSLHHLWCFLFRFCKTSA